MWNFLGFSLDSNFSNKFAKIQNSKRKVNFENSQVHRFSVNHTNPMKNKIHLHSNMKIGKRVEDWNVDTNLIFYEGRKKALNCFHLMKSRCEIIMEFQWRSKHNPFFLFAFWRCVGIHVYYYCPFVFQLFFLKNKMVKSVFFSMNVYLKISIVNNK